MWSHFSDVLRAYAVWTQRTVAALAKLSGEGRHILIDNRPQAVHHDMRIRSRCRVRSSPHPIALAGTRSEKIRQSVFVRRR
jgi:hypothetical protein